MTMTTGSQDSPVAARTAWVTGGARGIGLAIAEALGRRPRAHVVLLDRDEPALRQAVGQLEALGISASLAVVDLADADALERVAAALVQERPADMLVNNAGIAVARPALGYPRPTWDATLAINLTAPMLLAQHCLPGMRERGWGRIVNIASVSGLLAGIGRLAYGTSKAGLIALTRQLAVETGRSGITVNAVAPGMVETALTRSLHLPAQREAMLERVPQHRYGRVEEIAAAVDWLTGDSAAYVNGHTLVVDGGFSVAGWMTPTA